MGWQWRAFRRHAVVHFAWSNDPFDTRVPRALVGVAPAPPTQLTIATASKGSPYYRIAERYQQHLACSGIRLEYTAAVPS
jgi:TRAP-type uncharacterized transport system substrate-binding protein